MNNTEKLVLLIGVTIFTIGPLAYHFGHYTPSYPDRTAEVEELEAAVSNFGVMLDRACKFKNQGSGDWTYYAEATSTPPLVCDPILATSTEQL